MNLFYKLIENNTYKNNNIDNFLGAGGLAWLGYRLDMAGLTCSNHVRPIFCALIIIRRIALILDVTEFGSGVTKFSNG